MLFPIFSNANIQFIEKKPIQRSYTTAKALFTVELINKKKFAKTVLNENIKAFVIYMTSFNFSSISIYSIKKT